MISRESKDAADAKNSKTDKIHFYSSMTWCILLKFYMKPKWNIGFENCQNEKKIFSRTESQ